MFGAFLIDPSFWSRIGFLISYIVTSLLALEVLRLVSADANKRHAEKFLEQYSQQRRASVSPPRARRAPSPEKKTTSVNIDDLETAQPVMPAPRQVRAAVAPPTDESDVLEKRKRTTSSSRDHRHRTSSPEPVPLRRVRKRADTLNSTGSAESRRRHREVSPASESGSRHGSPRPRSREDKEKKGGLGLGRLVRGKV